MRLESLENALGFIGTVLGIYAFVYQFGPAIHRRLTQSPGVTRSKRSHAKAVENVKEAERPGEARGVAYALLAAAVWSISHNTFRSQPARACDPSVVAALVFIGGGVCVYGLVLIEGRLRGTDVQFQKISDALVTRIGIRTVFFNAVEFVLYLWAMKLLAAGQVMALWKTNPLWILLGARLFFKKRAEKASVAAMFCVVAGALYILLPEFSANGSAMQLRGSVVALLGGVFFAAYTICLHRLYSQSQELKKIDRYAMQAAMLVATGVLLAVWNNIVGAEASLNITLITIIIFNSIRIAISYILYTEAIALTRNPVLVAAVVCIEVPLTMLIEYAWYGDSAGANLWIGSAIVIVGIVSVIQENERHAHQLTAIVNRKKDGS